MAWFDRNPGGKKSSEVEPPKVAEAPKPAPEPIRSSPWRLSRNQLLRWKLRRRPSTAGLVGYLYKGSRISGQLSFQGSARIDGVVDGEIQCQGH